MTHSGGKEHAVGDKGQRWEVSFFNPALNPDAAPAGVFSFVIAQSPLVSVAVRWAQRRLALR